MRNKSSPYYKLLNETLEDEDFGDVSSFDEPLGQAGQRIRITVTKEDPAFASMYDDAYSGATGEILEEYENEQDDDDRWFMILLDNEVDGNSRIILPRRWFAIEEDNGDVSNFEIPVQAAREDMFDSAEEPTGLERGPYFNEGVEDDEEDEGDVSAFEAPDLPTYRGEVRIADIVDEYRARQTDENIRTFTVQYLLDHIPMEDFVEYRRNRDELQQLFKAVAKELKLHESIDDEDDTGDVSGFQAPIGLVGQRVQIDIEPLHRNDFNIKDLQGMHGVIVRAENALEDQDESRLVVQLDNSEHWSFPRAWVKLTEAVDEEEGPGKEGSKMATYKDVLRETRLYENAEDIAQDLSQMQGQPVESPIPPPPDAAPKATAPTASPATDQEQQVQALFTKYYPTMGTPGAVQQISTDLKLPYAAAHAMVSHYLSQFTESGYDKDWSIPLPGETVNLVSTEMAPLDKPGVNILAGNTPDIHADSEFDLPEYTKLGAYRKRKPYGESIEEVENEGDVAGFPGPPFPVEDMRAIYDTLVEINDFKNQISCLEGDDEDRAWRYERLIASIAHEEEFLKKEYNLTRKEAQELVQKYRGVIRENVEDEVEGHGDVSRFAPPHYESGDRVKINIPQELFSALDADTQRLNGRSGVIEDHESADESHTGEERVLVLIGETNGRFEWLPMAWVQFLDPLEEATQEDDVEDFGDVSDYEKPGWRLYYVDYVIYNSGSEFHHAKFAAPDDETALQLVVEGFTGQAFEEAAADFETTNAEEILENFSNSDMDIIEIYPVDENTRIFVGNGSFDGYSEDEDEVVDEDWEDE